MSILKFKEYITEQEELVIDTQTEVLMSQLEKANEDLDAVTEDPFVNSAIFMNAVRGTLERYGIVLPPSYTVPMLSAEAETVYTLGDSGMYLYICHNQNEDSLIEGYAQVVNQEELDDLVDMDKFASEEDEEEGAISSKPDWVPPARAKDDDSGNDSEYT